MSKNSLVRINWRKAVVSTSIMLFLIASATFVMRALYQYGLDETNVILIYLFIVFLIARYASGHIYGVFASFLCVFLFNYYFTAPMYSLNVYDSKYPLIFAIMLAISLLTSAMTVQLQKTSEEKVRLAKLEEQNRQMLALEKMRGTILRSISHDLRTPLTSISGAISLLAESPGLTEDERRRLLADVYQEAVWLNRFVENLLSMTRIDDNLLKIQFRPEMIEEVVGETVGIMRRRLGGRKLDIYVSDQCDVVNMDASLIEQVLINLIDNAIAHTSDEGRIAITVRCADEMAVFSIFNDGPGIKPEEIDHVFDRYFVGSEERSDARRGMGLGLSICQSIVKAHGGSIEVTSPNTGGVLFSFSLPFKGVSES